MQDHRPIYLAFKQAFQQYYQPLCQYAFTYTKGEHAAEDIVQEIFLHVWEKKQDLIGKDEIRYYLYTAVRNNCLSYLQKKKKIPITPLTGFEVIKDDAAFYPTDTPPDVGSFVTEALDRLPFKCREVFIMSRFSKLTYNQIGVSLGISSKTVENQIGKALKLMRAFVHEKQLYLLALVIYLGKWQ